MIALDKVEPDFYNAGHERAAIAFAALIATAMAAGEARGSDVISA